MTLAAKRLAAVRAVAPVVGRWGHCSQFPKAVARANAAKSACRDLLPPADARACKIRHSTSAFVLGAKSRSTGKGCCTATETSIVTIVPRSRGYWAEPRTPDVNWRAAPGAKLQTAYSSGWKNCEFGSEMAPMTRLSSRKEIPLFFHDERSGDSAPGSARQAGALHRS